MIYVIAAGSLLFVCYLALDALRERHQLRMAQARIKRQRLPARSRF
jgi:hypothetical protein